MYGKDKQAVIKKDSEEKKKGLCNCLSGLYQEVIKKRKKDQAIVSMGEYQVTMKENAMKFAERSLTLLLGQENEHGFRKWLWEQRSRRNQLKNEQV